MYPGLSRRAAPNEQSPPGLPAWGDMKHVWKHAPCLTLLRPWQAACAMTCPTPMEAGIAIAAVVTRTRECLTQPRTSQLTALQPRRAQPHSLEDLTPRPPAYFPKLDDDTSHRGSHPDDLMQRAALNRCSGMGRTISRVTVPLRTAHCIRFKARDLLPPQPSAPAPRNLPGQSSAQQQQDILTLDLSTHHSIQPFPPIPRTLDVVLACLRSLPKRRM